MKRLLTITAALAALALGGCDPDTTTRTAKNSPQDGGSTTYRYNGEIDGCHLYYVNPRYGSQYHFVKCERSTTTAWNEGCGKGCTRNMAVRVEDGE